MTAVTGSISVRTLTDGGQPADAIADDLVAFLAEARATLDLALYDVRLPGAVGDRVADAIRAAAARGAAVRIAYNVPDMPAQYARDFASLWARRRVEDSGDFDTTAIAFGGATVRPWFSPGRGDALSHRIAEAIGKARRRVRIAPPVLTSSPILGTLAEVTAERKVDVLGVCDWTQLHAVFGQWRDNGRSAWKMPLLAKVLEGAQFTGKRSTPYAGG
jgi:phosphatidylserine/phosphatidylglycerophosphate/cardiolipin synthase-like enzyme